MKKFLFFMILSIGLVFASCKKETPDPGYFAGIAAKGYYDLLLEGKYNDLWLDTISRIVFLKVIMSNCC